MSVNVPVSTGFLPVQFEQENMTIAQYVTLMKQQVLAAAVKANVNNNVPLGVRQLRPSDFTIISSVTTPSNASSISYQWTIAAGSSTILAFNITSTYVIGWVGWYSNNLQALGPGGYIDYVVNGIVRYEIPTQLMAQAPYGVYYTFDAPFLSNLQIPYSFVVYNSTTTSATVFLWPVGFIAGPKSNLHID